MDSKTADTADEQVSDEQIDDMRKANANILKSQGDDATDPDPGGTPAPDQSVDRPVFDRDR